jgi:hypothetical protein
VNPTSSDDQLTPEEVATFIALPRATSSHDQLAEERVVQGLRAARLLAPPTARRSTRLRSITIGIAAALLIFVAGTFFGRRLAAREVRSASPSMQVQQAGTAYVAALVRLSTAKDSERSPGLEAGTATLRAAATSLALIDPSDSTARRIRTSLDATTNGVAGEHHAASDHSVIWF